MIVFLVFLLSISCCSKFVFHSPDYLSRFNLAITPLKLGTPAFYKVYGTLFIVDTFNCETSYYGSNEKFLVFLNPINCNITDLAIKSYQAGTPLVMLVDDDKSTLSEKIGKSTVPENFPNITTVTVPEIIHSLVYNVSVVSASYIYDITKYFETYIDIILGGDHDNDKHLVDSFSNLHKNYNIDPLQISFNFNYKLSSNTSSDCINYYDYYYCKDGINEYSGIEVLDNIILTLSYYNTLPKTRENLLVFLDYLSFYYSKCYKNYTLSCNSEVLLFYTTNIDFFDYNLFFSAYFNTYVQGYLIINFQYFPWNNYIEQGYCLASYTPSPKCPKCSSDCISYMFDDINCHPQCNNTLCGYQNLQCLKVYPGCYNFMLYDGICNEACYELNSNSDCVVIADPFTETTPENFTKEPSAKVYIPVIIVFGFIIIFILVTFIYVLKRKRRNRELEVEVIRPKTQLEVQKFSRVVKILGEVVCPIDLEEFNENDDVVVTPCQHVFHPGCLKQWIEKAINIGKACPICKNRLSDIEITNRI